MGRALAGRRHPAGEATRLPTSPARTTGADVLAHTPREVELVRCLAIGLPLATFSARRGLATWCSSLKDDDASTCEPEIGKF